MLCIIHGCHSHSHQFLNAEAQIDTTMLVHRGYNSSLPLQLSSCKINCVSSFPTVSPERATPSKEATLKIAVWEWIMEVFLHVRAQGFLSMIGYTS